MYTKFKYYAQKALDFKLSTKAKKTTNVFIFVIISQFIFLVVFVILLLGNKTGAYNV